MFLIGFRLLFVFSSVPTPVPIPVPIPVRYRWKTILNLTRFLCPLVNFSEANNTVNNCPIRTRMGVAVLENKMYAMGGTTGGMTLNSVECYDPVQNKWTSVTPMRIHRSGVG